MLALEFGLHPGQTLPSAFSQHASSLGAATKQVLSCAWKPGRKPWQEWKPGQCLQRLLSHRRLKRRRPRPLTKKSAMIKFIYVSTRKRAMVSILKKVSQLAPDATLAGPCDLGCILTPCHQCFNNIQWSMAFYCVLFLSQGIVFGLIDVGNNFEQDHIVITTEE